MSKSWEISWKTAERIKWMEEKRKEIGSHSFSLLDNTSLRPIEILLREGERLL